MELSLQASVFAQLCLRPFAAVRVRPLVAALLKMYDTKTKENEAFLAQTAFRVGQYAQHRPEGLPPMPPEAIQVALDQRTDVLAVPRGLPWSAATQMIVDMSENRLQSGLSRDFAEATQAAASTRVKRELTGGEMRAIISTILFPDWFADEDESARQLLCNFNLFERLKVEPDLIGAMAQGLATAAERYLAALDAQPEARAARRPPPGRRPSSPARRVPKA